MLNLMKTAAGMLSIKALEAQPLSSEAAGFLIWACVALLGVIAYIGTVIANRFTKMADDLSAIKVSMASSSAAFLAHEKRIADLERDVEKIKDRL